MAHYVYIIESLLDGTLYKGYTTDYARRLEEHNSGLSKYTSTKLPWVLRYVEVHDDKTTALKRELMFKKQKRIYFEWLFEQPSNILKK
ncbi:GIY-YIG nuclease family protein [Rurimicrobium arvi]|uniref:GIY-YIG domain-containing protein n=1 Tax=Rurimicrobium arvi TaxID=2049916 RepID=A0ABP8MKI2_9BACT